MADGQITIGTVQITGLSDGEMDHHLSMDRLFPAMSPDVQDSYRLRYPGTSLIPNRWHVNVGCYLIRSMGRTILVDMGAGAADGPVAASLGRSEDGRLLEAIEAAGSTPAEVDFVCLTHPHRDHVGWSLITENGQRRLAFPNARYLLQQADWETFHKPEIQAARNIDYMGAAITPLKDLGALELAAGDYRVTDEVTAIHTPGHTPGHMCILVASGGQQAIVTGDVLVHPVQFADPDTAFNFDMDPVAARRTRRELVERIEAEGITVAAGHLPGPGFGKLVREDGHLFWQPLETQLTL